MRFWEHEEVEDIVAAVRSVLLDSASSAACECRVRVHHCRRSGGMLFITDGN